MLACWFQAGGGGHSSHRPAALLKPRSSKPYTVKSEVTPGAVPRQELAAAVAAEGLRPTQARGAPPGFNTLLAACWALDPAARPSAAAVAVELSRLLRQQGKGGGLGMGDHAAGAAPGAAGAAVTTGGSAPCAGLGLDSTAARQGAAAAADWHANANGACSPGSASARAHGPASGRGGLAQAGAAGGTAHESAAGPAGGRPRPDPAAQAAGSAWPASQWSDMPARPYRPEVRLSSAPAAVLLNALEEVHVLLCTPTSPN